MTDRLMTILMLAEYICASTRTVRRILASGEIPSYRVRGKVMVKLSDIELWLEGNRIQPKGNEKNDLKSLVAKAVTRARERRLAS